MVKMVIALCLFINGELREHRVQDSMSDCLKAKREMTRNLEGSLSQTMCGEVEAIIEVDTTGSESKYRIVEILEKG